ncbi:CAP domain-containing protein [Chelatococcus sp. SYSU_G07232]|uniref:CAP domain-containing protein n=1 Tax=Chelatococcus albus TaxID=3047466 RepID=A0ABT7AD01_9HYPH|nr:CAP domain-containing protein [Chelatococcus sp. SYSU_G07232]MDJ1157234.1 CAP domain-containing protein [Chelatococcus sp. SYSU_G07232]
MRRTKLLAAPLFLSLAACSGLVDGTRLKVESVDSRDAPAAAATISRFRASQGLGAVKVDDVLNAAARQQAEAMAANGKLSHNVAGSFDSRMQAMGFKWGYSAENLGMGYDDLAEAVAGWQASPGHRKNLLMPQATRIGLARARSGRTNYWALVLASPDMTPDGRPKVAEAGNPRSAPFSWGSGFVAHR